MTNATTVPIDLKKDFAPVSYADWKATVEAELKGVPFDKKLLTQTYEGITLRPLYTADDIANLQYLQTFPGFTPFPRGSHAAGYLAESWEISEEIPYASPRDFNNAARQDLSRGLTALQLNLDAATRAGLDPDWSKAGDVGRGGVSIATLRALSVALEEIDLEKVSLFVRSGSAALPFAAILAALARQRGVDLKKIHGCIEMDPLGVLSHEGLLPYSLGTAYREMAQLARWSAQKAPELQTICVHARAYHESGGSAVEELAFALATGAEYLRELSKLGLTADEVAPRIRFMFCLGSNFFMEIAKLRAARLLWARIVAAFGGSEESQRMYIHAKTGQWNKTLLDPYVNLLRSTTEAFSAVLGGTDSLQVSPFDELAGLPDDFSRRIARNTQLVLKHEAHTTHVVDPAGGSWYVEWLTDALAQKAWKLFQDVEAKGGMAQALKDNVPQQTIAKVAAARDAAVAKRKDTIVGNNAYPNLTEQPLPDCSPDYIKIYEDRVTRVKEFRTSYDSQLNTQVLKKLSQLLDATNESVLETAIEAAASGATLGEITRVLRASEKESVSITPLKLRRIAEPFEQLRAASSRYATKHGTRPKIFLATMGPLAQFKARADFAKGFFAVGGFECVYPKGFATPEDAAKAAAESGAKVAVICSTDETYPEIVPAFVKAFKAAKPDGYVILAGYPTEQIEAHKASGVNEFIHLRADLLAILKNLQKQIGAL